ncbi:MAG TPA: 4-alpha-glucanotransferase [Streptosporangiaceae bacterium]
MTDPDLIRRAQNAGIAASYENWRRECVEVPAETLAAILGVLEDNGKTPETFGTGATAAVQGAAVTDTKPAPPAASPAPAARVAAPAAAAAQGSTPDTARPVVPRARQWGFTVQLYSVRSRDSWGHGDLHDLADMAKWSAAQLGAGFVLVNPLHAAEPVPPVSNSPYLPMTRLFTSPLYLRPEDVPEYANLSAADRRAVRELARPLRAANLTADLIDRDAVWRAKREALMRIRQVPLTASRQAAYDGFRAERGRDLEHWTAWCALAERHGPDWRRWPPELADRRSAEQAVRSDPELSGAADFHAWLQWHADEQLAAAQEVAKSAGMAHGIIHDLAVGVHPGGSDAWAHPELLVPGFSVGAPPDGFNQLGQDWGQPPWQPRHLATAGYRPLEELFEATLRHGSGLRVDHVMGLMRLWWIPAGQRPDRGAYVSYDHRASVAALAGAAARASAVAIGEDLGTVDPWISDYLAEHDILGTMMIWFASDPDGNPLPPQQWRRDCMATVGTHDVPPVSGFVTGDQVTVRSRLGLLNTSEERERAQARATLERWRAALEGQGLLAPGHPAGPAEFTVAMYGYLRRTPALLLGVSLADAVGDVRTQNVPGTSDEYPNWRIPLCDGEQHPVLIEDLPDSPLLRDVCRAVTGEPVSRAG